MPQGSGPHGIHFDAQSRLWVTLEFLPYAQVDPGRRVAAYGMTSNIDCYDLCRAAQPHPHGLAVGPDGETVWYTGKSTSINRSQ